MAVKLIIPFVLLPVVLLLLGSKDSSAQSVPSSPDLPNFMGRKVTIAEPERDIDGFPKGPASVCVEGPPQRQCYIAPKAFGNSPTVAMVQLEKDISALLFSAASGGVSGWEIHFALLCPETGKDLQDLFGSRISVSNQSQYAFWNVSAISDAQIFVTTDYVLGQDDGHYGAHRYIISAYVRTPSVDDGLYYDLEDRYMTARRYDLGENMDILTSEKLEILGRLGRLKAGTELQR